MLKQIQLVGQKNTKEPLLSRIRKRPYRTLIIILCLINTILIVVNAGLWFEAGAQKLFIAADFTSFYTGYYIVRTGQGENLYNSVLQSEIQNQLMHGLEFEGGLLPYTNPPFVAFVFSPLSLLPLNYAFYLWTFIQFGLLLWILLCLNRIFSHWGRWEKIILFITILAFWPLTYTFLLGQFTLLLLLGLLQMYIAMKNKKLVQAGLWMFLLIIKPQALPIPAMITVNKRNWRIAVSAIIAGSILFIATSLVIGLKPWAGFVRSLSSYISYFGVFGSNPANEYTLRGLIANLLGISRGNTTNFISIFVLVIAMLVIWLLWRRNINHQNPMFDLSFATTITLAVFLSLHMNPYDTLILVLPAALFYEYLRKKNLPKKAYSIFLLISPAIFLFSSFNKFNILGVLRLPVIWIVVYLLWMFRYMLEERHSDSNSDAPITLPIIIN